MQFPTLGFAIFFIFVYLIAIPLKHKVEDYKKFLLLVSLIFYGLFGKDLISSVLLVSILLAIITVNYAFLYASSPSKFVKLGDGVKKAIFALGIISNLAVLIFYKYYKVGIDYLIGIKPEWGIEYTQILIPIGISFLIFRIIGHLVDTYKSKVALPSFIEYGTFVAFFPQVAIGPIARADTFYTNLDMPTVYRPSTGRVIYLLASGLFKKLVIASYIYTFIAKPFQDPSQYSQFTLGISAFAYAVMLYTDFSGYSDISIAMSNLMGFNVGDNFNQPYRAVGLKDFWGRWHISLSTWLRDYIYIPLGGNMKGESYLTKLWNIGWFKKIFAEKLENAQKTFKYLNIFITMILSGLWHGAGATFFVWGVMHAVGSVVSHFIEDLVKQKTPNERDSNKLFTYLMIFIGWIITQAYITLTWVYFNSPNLDTANRFALGILTGTGGSLDSYSNRLILIIVGYYIWSWIAPYFAKRLTKILDTIPTTLLVLIAVLIFYVIFSLRPETMPPFIYFNF